MITSKQKIIDVYLQLLKEKHHATLSVKEITDIASISRTTFYSHFRDKEDILKVVAEKLDETYKERDYTVFTSYCTIGYLSF